MISYGPRIFEGGAWCEGYLVVDGGKAHLSRRPAGEVVEAFILPPIVNAHVHSADWFLRNRLEKMDLDLESAVGPDGFKMRELRMADDGTLMRSIRSFYREAQRHGTQVAFDFREGGIHGVEILRKAVEQIGLKVIALGRPDPDELEEWRLRGQPHDAVPEPATPSHGLQGDLQAGVEQPSRISYGTSAAGNKSRNDSRPLQDGLPKGMKPTNVPRSPEAGYAERWVNSGNGTHHHAGGRPAEGGVTNDIRSPDGYVASLLNVVDGLGISAISDIGEERAMELARAVHSAGKILALHFSEAVREDVDTLLRMRPHMVIHCVMCTEEDLRRIAMAGIPVVVCPRSNHRFGLQVDMDAMFRAGVKVMVGTDNGMISTPSVREELLFMIDHLEISLERALTALENAKVLNQIAGIEPKPRYTVVAGHEDMDALKGEILGTVAGEEWRSCDEDQGSDD